MKKKIQGFIEPEIVLQGPKKHWVLGASDTPVFPDILQDGNWESDYPLQGELQNRRNIETFNCTGFNTAKIIQAIVHRSTGQFVNYSDRWIGIIAGTKEPGNDPHKVAEAIREFGMIPEEMLPFSDDIKNADEYYSFKGLTQEQIDACYAEGKKWLATYKFMHAWVFTPGQPVIEQRNNIKIALKSSPLGIAVYAWASNEKDVYYSLGSENHWTSVYNEEEFLKVYDSYEPFKKLVDQSLRYCKRYSVTLKKKEDSLTEEQKLGFLAQLKKIFDWLMGIQKQVDALPKQPPVTVQEAPVSTEVPKDIPKYDWSTKAAIRHSIRVICDEEKMSVSDKNDMCATIQAESGFILTAKNENYKNILVPDDKGKVSYKKILSSTDWGLCQWNDYWHKDEITPEESVNNPEKAVRLMAKYWKMGIAYKLWWIAFKNGSYKNYL